jgi:hypothetical protein
MDPLSISKPANYSMREHLRCHDSNFPASETTPATTQPSSHLHLLLPGGLLGLIFCSISFALVSSGHVVALYERSPANFAVIFLKRSNPNPRKRNL